MKIVIASMNKQKLLAVEEVISELKFHSVFQQIEISSEVSTQPMTIEEAIKGAKNRARKAFEKADADYAVGIESGAASFGDTQNLFVTNVCALYNGKKFDLGFSSSFPFPYNVSQLMKKKNITMGQAMLECGFTRKVELGKEEGTVGILTNGRLNRKDYLKEAVFGAFVSLLHPEWY